MQLVKNFGQSLLYTETCTPLSFAKKPVAFDEGNRESTRTSLDSKQSDWNTGGGKNKTLERIQ